MFHVPQYFREYVNGDISIWECRARAFELAQAADPQSTILERVTGTMSDSKNWDVPQRLKMPSYFLPSGKHERDWQRADWQSVHMGIQEWAARFLLEAKRYEIPLFVHEAYRTAAMQAQHFRNGHTKLQGNVAPHRQGKAVDIVHGRYGWTLTDDEWLFLNKMGLDVHRRMMAARPAHQRFDLEWGGDWRRGRAVKVGWDPAHWEVKGWRSSLITIAEGVPIPRSPKAILSRL